MDDFSRATLLAVLLIFGCASGSCSTDATSNDPPTVAGVPTDETVVVGDTFRLTISAQDPEGGNVSFDYDWRPKEPARTLDEATFIARGNEAVFEWGPIASDATSGEPIRLIFIVTDSAGSETQKTVNLTVIPGNGMPRFTSNASELFDPRASENLEFEVRVRDDDDTEVQLTMLQDSAPVGSSFSQVGPMEGMFTWTPSGDQIKKRVHAVSFRAEDSQGQAVEFKVTIVVRTRADIDIDKDQVLEMCPGEAAIEHRPLSAQRTLDDYTIEASLLGPESDRFDTVFLYWTTSDAFNNDFDPNDENKRLHAVELTSEGSLFQGTIPNQLGLVAADKLPLGETTTVFYNICAIDNDVSDASAVVCTPSSGELELFYSFEVYNPEDEECIDDNLDRAGFGGNDDFDSAAAFEVGAWKGYRVCEGDADFHSVRVKPGEAYVVSALFNAGSDIEFRAFDDSQSQIGLDRSDCTGLVSATVSVPETGTEKSFYIEATGNDTNYQVKSLRLMGGVGGCIDEDMEPNGTAFDATPVQNGDTIEAEICGADDRFDIYAIELQAGEQLTATHEFSNINGNLDMELYAPSQIDEVGDIGAGIVYTSDYADVEVLEHTASETGTFYLLVFNNNEGGNSYTLTFEVSAAPPCSDADSYSNATSSGNHSQDDAALIGQGDNGFIELMSMEVCPNKPDWYRRTEFNGELILGTLAVTDGGSIDDVTLEVFDSSRTKVSTATKNGDELELSFTPSSSDQYFYRISAENRTTYNLSLLR